MAVGVQITSYVPTSLLNVNSPSPTLAAEVVTGYQIPTGAFPGNTFFLSEQWAQMLSFNTCHAGWYQVVQVAPTAVAANIAFGTIGAQRSIPVTQAQSAASVPFASIVTDASTVLNLGINPVVFLGPVTPGNFTIVQLAGDGVALLAAGQTAAVGSILISTAAGTVAVSGTYTSATIGLAEAALTTPAALTLSAVAAASGGSAVYTGTITGGAANAFAGLQFVITGFTGAAAVDNGTYLATASTATTLTLSNANAVAVTAAGTATSQGLIRVNIAPAFSAI